MAGAERGREYVEVLGKLLRRSRCGPCAPCREPQVQDRRAERCRGSPRTARCSAPAAHRDEQAERGRTPRSSCCGSRSICATSTSSANPSSQRKLRFRLLLVARSPRAGASTSLRRAAACSSAGSVTKSPSRATSALFERRLQSERIVNTASARMRIDDERHERATTAAARPERRLVRRCRTRRRGLVREGHGLDALHRDLDVDRSGSGCAVDRTGAGTRCRAGSRARRRSSSAPPATRSPRHRCRLSCPRSSGGRPDVKSGDSMPTVNTRIFCASSWASAESRLVVAADVVAVGEEHDPRRAERRAANLCDRGDERVVDARALCRASAAWRAPR